MDTLILWSSLIGGAAFALSGFLLGIRHKLDVMGIFILAFITANGGGILRDMMTGQTPVVLKDLSAFWLVSVVFIIGCALHFMKHIDIEQRRFFILSDTLGLVAFSIGGALTGLAQDLHFFGVVFLAFITAVGGGIIRDILVNDVPIIFKGGFYGSVAILIGLAIYGLSVIGLLNSISLIAVFACGVVVRLIAYRYRWTLSVLRSAKISKSSPKGR